MSKVYSFRLDENNPREAQAMGVIDAWVAQGYSFRNIIVDALIAYQSKDKQNDNFDEIMRMIRNLLENRNSDKNSDKFEESSLPKTFVSAISESAKSGIGID